MEQEQPLSTIEDPSERYAECVRRHPNGHLCVKMVVPEADGVHDGLDAPVSAFPTLAQVKQRVAPDSRHATFRWSIYDDQNPQWAAGTIHSNPPMELMPSVNDFGWALARLRQGERVARPGWNGKGMWLVLVEEDRWALTAQRRRDAVPAGELRKLPWIGMRTADGAFVPWLASQTDMLATDWTAVS